MNVGSWAERSVEGNLRANFITWNVSAFNKIVSKEHENVAEDFFSRFPLKWMEREAEG